MPANLFIASLLRRNPFICISFMNFSISFQLAYLSVIFLLHRFKKSGPRDQY